MLLSPSKMGTFRKKCQIPPTGENRDTPVTSETSDGCKKHSSCPSMNTLCVNYINLDEVHCVVKASGSFTSFQVSLETA